MATPGPDEGLRPYATERQWEYLEAIAKHGDGAKAARALGVAKSAVNRARAAVEAKAARHGYAPDFDMLHPTAPGFSVKGTSTLYDNATGEARLQWVKTSVDQEQQEKLFREMVDALAADLPRVDPVPTPAGLSDDLCVGIPVSDHHTGMLAWHEENGGANYNLDECERLLRGAIDHLIATAPPAGVCLLALMGDLLHYDSNKPVTPTHGYQLDADSRPSQMVRVAIRICRYMIEAAKRRFGHVHVIVEIGNHDLYSSIFLMEALAVMYENDDRVVIDTSPRHYHYFRFGKCLIGTHHGHGPKLPQLPLIMASDRKEDWGATTYRYWWTGHVHHDQVKDYQGVKVESFRVLPPQDAHADQAGYRSMRDLKSIVFHKEYGEVSRHTVNPEMLL